VFIIIFFFYIICEVPIADPSLLGGGVLFGSEFAGDFAASFPPFFSPE
jgi:hypothetical protein